ncbi:MAG TPA: hypothetical protein ENK57_04780 [Polyangiaceae bacterium]|nr:hypothetical protein [Polyangiaceae bacterium]
MHRTTRRAAGLVTILASLLSLAAAGCGPTRRQWTPQQTSTQSTTGASHTVAATGVVATGTPAEQLAQLEGLLRQQGMTPVAPTVHGNLAANGMVAYAVDAVPNACYTLAVIGDDSAQNIDMVVIDPYGRTATHHVLTDNHPWASFCASQAGRFIARVQMSSGAGTFSYVAYQGPADRRLELSSFYGDAPAATVQTAQMDAQTQQRLSTLDQRLQTEGFSRVGNPVGMVLTNSDPRDFQLNLEQGQCYVFAALGTDGAIDTDVFLNDSSGRRIEADGSTAPDARIRYCAQVTGPYVLQVRMLQGQGSLFTVGYVQQGAQAGPQPVMASSSTAGAGLQENFALLDADMRARGYESYGSQTNGSLEQGGSRTLEIQLEGGLCYAILAVGDTTVNNLDLHLLDPRGRPVDQDTAPDARPTVRVCPRSSGNYQMQVSMTSGSGAFVYAPYRWPRGTRGPFGLEGVTWVRLSEVTALLDVEGYEPDPGFTPGRGRLRRQGASASHQVELVQGQCYAIVAVGGEGISDLDITITFGGTQLASDYGSGNAFPSVRHCAQSSGQHTIQITAAAGSGSYHYQIFSRADDS